MLREITNMCRPLRQALPEESEVGFALGVCPFVRAMIFFPAIGDGHRRAELFHAKARQVFPHGDQKTFRVSHCFEFSKIRYHTARSECARVFTPEEISMKKFFAIAFLATQMVWGQAAPLRMICSNGVRAAILDLKADWERAIGRPVAIEFGATAELRQKIDAGEAFDIAVLTPEATADLTKQGKLMAGTNAEIARVGIGFGIKQGAPKPDVSSPEAVKQTLMKTKSIALVKVGASRAYIEKMYDRLGAGDALKAKTLYEDSTEHAGEAVASGKAGLSIMPMSEIPLVKGVVVAAPLPGDLQNYLRFEVAVVAKTKDAATAKKAVAYLTSAAAKPVFKAKGMQ